MSPGPRFNTAPNATVKAAVAANSPPCQFIVPPVPRINAPNTAPPFQLSWPVKVNSGETFGLPLTFNVSAAAGVPGGVQLPGSYQSLFTSPVQVRVAAQAGTAREMSHAKTTNLVFMFPSDLELHACPA